MKHLLSLIPFLLLLAHLYAQPVRNTVERGQDRNQIARDQATIDRDRAELTQFLGYQQGLKSAVAGGDISQAHVQKMKLTAAMQNEIAQSEAKVAGATHEVHQSGAEVRSDTREVHRDKASGRPVAAAGDRADRRDDIVDKADDRNDLAERLTRLARQKEILATLQALNAQTAGLEALRAKMNLIDEFERTMRRDMGENVEEAAENRGEIREDRRETREDRNHR